MQYKLEEILASENPYQLLNDGDAFAFHQKDLEQLNLQDKKQLATKIVLGCPDTELKKLGSALNALRTPRADLDYSFHAIIEKAFFVKSTILSLLDSRNKNPHNKILNGDFNPDLFNEYKELANQVLSNKETKIAERLALTTPENQRSNIAFKLDNIFPKSTLCTKVGNALLIRWLADRSLLDEHPEQFFLSKEFNVDICLEHNDLLMKLIEGKEEDICKKLAAVNNGTWSEIDKCLAPLNTFIPNQNNFFEKIGDVLGQVKRMSLATNPNGLFNEGLRAQEQNTSDNLSKEPLGFTL